MSNRTFAAALLSIAAMAATLLAGGEAMGQTTQSGKLANQSAKTREQVIQELRAWRANPVTADGYREVNGDAGWKYVGSQTKSTNTREQVKQEARAWFANPVTLDGYRQVNGDHGWVYVGPQIPQPTKTREQVVQELRAWRANPVTPDGYREVHGEMGWIYEGR